MGSPTVKRRLAIYVALLGSGLAVCAWQAEEHVRFRDAARQTLINRGRDITSTFGALLRAQRRFYGSVVISKERLEASLRDMLGPDAEVGSIAVLGASGTTIASAGGNIELTPDMLAAGGPFWRDRTVTLFNVVDLNVPQGDDAGRTRPPIVVSTDDRLNFRPPPSRRFQENGPRTPAPEGATAPDATATTTVVPAPPPAENPPGRSAFGRSRGQGVHSLVLTLSTVEMRRAVRADLLLRSLVSLLAMGGAIASVFALRNVAKNSELQIRLVKAGEMNTHLKEMNLAAAGLAHETRNPLNLIRGLAQMITLQAKDAPKLREHATTIMEETDRVTVQLNEFINYSKPREPQLMPIQVSRLVADVARTLVPDIEEKRIELRQPESDLFIEADEQLLRQALFNVLLNATQAVAPGGRIEVRLTATGPREAVLEVCDDGPGVPAADRAAIFKPYVTMRPKGVGLGLAIVAQIAAAHHWEVACLANEPHGALFRFTHLKIANPAS